MSRQPFILVLLAAFVGVSAAYALGLWGVAGGIGFPLDDAFIHLQFARNLYHSQVMSFNEGIPSSGSSAPGYTAALALVYLFVRDWWWTSYVVGGVASLGIVYGCYRILLQWTDSEPLARLGALLLLLSYPTIILAYSGMEPPLHVGAFILGLWWYGRGDARGRLKASAAFALGVWFRPEMLLMGPLMVAERALDQPKPGGLSKHRSELIGHALVWSVALAVYMGFNYSLDGHLLPSTYAAKAQANSLGRTAPDWFDGLPSALQKGHWLWAAFAISVWPLAVLLSTGLTLLISNGPLLLWSVRRVPTAWREPSSTRPAERLALLTFVGFPLARGAVQPIGLFPFQFERYFAHLLPIAILFGLSAWARTGAVPGRAKKWAFGFAIGGNLIGCTHALMAVGNINQMQVAMGRYLNRTVSPHGLVATNDIGAVAFMSERPVLDMMGLVEPKLVSHYLAGGSTLDYVEARAPEVAVVFPSWFPELAQSPHWQRVHSIRVEPNVICGGPEFVVYRNTELGTLQANSAATLPPGYQSP